MSKTKLNNKEYDLSKDKSRTEYWTKYAEEKLVGKPITKVNYLTSKECNIDFGWNKRPITLTLDTGEIVIAQMDDEGNDGGVLLIEYPGETVEFKHTPGVKFQKTATLPVLDVEE